MCWCMISAASSVCPSIPEDFIVHPKLIISQWRQRKLSHQQCLEDLLESRDPSAIRLSDFVNAVRQRERERVEEAARNQLLGSLEVSLGAFRGHANIDKFLRQYDEASAGKPFWRFRFLLLRGRSRMGKTQKAMSLYGIKCSMVVNCQGLQTTLPSLRAVAGSEIKCIIFDEVSAEQVLANKLVFQAGPWPVTLGQSACGQHAYTLNLYALPMVCCSNDFKTSEEDGLSADAAQWLAENMLEASPPESCAWFWPSESEPPPVPILPQ